MKAPTLLVVTTLALSAGCDRTASSSLESESEAEPTEGEPTASSSPKPVATPSTTATAPNRNALFLSMFGKQLPKDLCKPEQYFRACFQVTEERCKQVVTQELNKCVAIHSATLPLVRDGKTGAAAGRVLGQCAGTAYDVHLIAKRIQSSRCNDPSQWVGK